MDSVFSIVITEKGGAQRQLDFEGNEVSIGRLEDNDVCLPKNNVSKHHARIVWKDDRYVVVDQKSTNGTYVNGRRISAPMVVRKGDKIYIGDFILMLAASPAVAREPAPESLRPPPVPREALRAAPSPAPVMTMPAPAPVTAPSAPPPTPAQPSAPAPKAAPAPKPPPSPARESSLRPSPKSIPPWASDDPSSAQGNKTSPAVLAPSVRLQGALSMLMERLAAQLDVRRPEEAAFPSEHHAALERLIDELADEGAIGPDLDRRFLRDSAVSEAVGLGPLDRLLTNRAVREVVVDGPARILADLGGGLSPVSSFFSSDAAVLVAAQRLWGRAGLKLDPKAPVQEAQLPGGGLVQLLLPPLSPKGPLISLRCPPRAQSSADGLVTDGLLSMDMLALLRSAVHAHKNVLVLGPLGAGVSSLLSALITLAPDHERVVTIEDAPSASLSHPQTIPLCRNAAPGLQLADLLKHASRLRFDRLVIDDVAPKDALAALSCAASTTGVMLGMHAPSPAAALTQLELYAQAGLSASRAGQSLATLVAAAVQVLVHVAPGKDGSRRIQSLSEVRGAQGDTLEVRTLYRCDNGSFRATEHRASFLPS